jgi:hypothetical protein
VSPRCERAVSCVVHRRYDRDRANLLLLGCIEPMGARQVVRLPDVRTRSCDVGLPTQLVGDPTFELGRDRS